MGCDTSRTDRKRSISVMSCVVGSTKKDRTTNVVCASVDEEHAPVLGSLERGLVALEVEADRGGVVVRVRDRLDADVVEDGVVVHCGMTR